jgi:putative oxidoreductase
MNKRIDNTIILRITMAITLLAHSIPSIVTNDVYNFGAFFLDEAGFYPIGVPLAWVIKILHVVCAALFLLNRFVTVAAYATMVVLVGGIIMVHYPEGWFVVGGGRNGMEFNVVLILVLISIVYQQKFDSRK